MYELKIILNEDEENLLGSYNTTNEAIKYILESNNINISSIRVVSASPYRHIYHIESKSLTYCVEYKEA